MNQKQKNLLSLFIIIISLCFVAFISIPAPTSVNPNKAPHPPICVRSIFGQAPYLIVWIIAAVEALSLAIMLRRQGFRTMRMFFAWLPVTWITFWLPFMCCKFVTEVPLILKLIIGEMVVIYLESILLYIITLVSFFYRERTYPLTPLQAIRLSVIINIITIFTFFLLFLLVTADERFRFSFV